MALSDYDVITFDTDGESSLGKIENYLGCKLEIYKNWVYLSHPKMWFEGNGYNEPLIAEIHEGQITICGFEIYAKRCAQNGIMVIVIYHDADYNNHYYFGGIGCLGYVDRVEEIVAKMEVDPKLDWMHMTSNHWDEEKQLHIESEGLSRCTEDGNFEELVYKIYTPPDKMPWPDWIGVAKETLGQFFEFAESLKIHLYHDSYNEWVEKCRETEPVRYNQGNMYFAEQIDTGMLQVTKVGEAQEPSRCDMSPSNETPEVFDEEYEKLEKEEYGELEEE